MQNLLNMLYTQIDVTILIFYPSPYALSNLNLTYIFYPPFVANLQQFPIIAIAHLGSYESVLMKDDTRHFITKHYYLDAENSN